MFSKKFSMRKKNSDEGRQPRSRSDGSHLIPPGESPPIQEGGAASLRTILRVAKSSIPSSRRTNEADQGPLGLNVVYTPENGHKADIVFIHGLGGSSRMTWSKYKNPELFWPLKFLPLEADVCLARISSFGYQANFRKAGNISTAILDFAKELLYDLKYATDEQGQDLNMGDVPLLFVVHSMGGLVVKEAYMQGQNDPKYERIVKSISAIIFLSTPHRGTNLADLLNRILQSSGVSNSKQYISELAKNSFTLQKLNEQFRHIAPKLDIVSFYETQPTSIGLKSARVMVLEKDSSVLGYPGEISKALNADHHGICKFENNKDPNYITVRNILKSLMSKIISSNSMNSSNRPQVSNRRESRDLKSLLAISELPDVDYIFFRDQWTPGTNMWILEEDSYVKWLTFQGLMPCLLWLKGGAASGKSVLSSFIINSLVEQGFCCQYFFIRFGDWKKRTLSLLLRSIAYQVALQLPGFMEQIVELGDEAIDFEAAEPKTIWESIFKCLLFKMENDQPLYWVIDGLDEADDTRATLRLLSDIAMSAMPIRILLLSRETPEIAAALRKMPNTMLWGSINIGGQLNDLHCHIRQEISISGSSEFLESTFQRILEGSQSNFLWVRLAVEKINTCHTRADVERALQELPSGMEAIYDRMALTIASHKSASDRALASNILQRVACSFRVLTVAELSQALEEDTSEMLDFQQSLVELCGGFVVIDNGGNVAMIHQTAREYLLGDEQRPFQIHRESAHEQLFLSCMRCLMARGLRGPSNRDNRPEFLHYSASWWSSHLQSVSSSSEKIFNTLRTFLTGSSVLSWIQTLAIDNQLRILIVSSRNLSKYAGRRKKHVALRDEQSHIVEQHFIENWAVDFVKLVGKFGPNLRRNPESIHKLIPPFCPHNSAIYQQFGKSEVRSIAVSGVSSQNWDDSLARLSFGFGTYASSISAAGAHIAILASTGSVFIYDSSVFEETAGSPIKHGERVYRMALNTAGTLLVTHGFKTTKIWDISAGKMFFDGSECGLPTSPTYHALDDRRIRSLDINTPSPTWQIVAELEEPELEGHFLNSASYMALNSDGTLLAVAYRGYPLSAWEINGPFHIDHCWRTRDEVSRGEVIEAVWHPHSPEILGLYIEGVVFKWNPYEGAREEMATGASRLAISRDGNIFATGDVHGTVKIFTTSNFNLLYQLPSQDTVLDLAFSPDIRRFYDIRGYYGNAWEPNALMRYAEQSGTRTESESETESIVPSSIASTSPSQRIDSITVLVASPIGKLYCCGTEYGTVRLFDAQKGMISDLYVSRSFLSIEKLAWSQDGQFISFCDTSKKVYIVPLAFGNANSDPIMGTLVQISLRNNTKGPIIQLLFNADSSKLLVYTSSTICTILLGSSSVTDSMDWQLGEYKWITHPQDPQLILAFGPATIRILDWSLTQKYSIPFEYQLQADTESEPESVRTSSVVDRVLVTPDKRHILIQISLGLTFKQKTFLYFAVSDFPSSAEGASNINPTVASERMAPIILPQDIASQISLALSLLTHDRLIFLSKDFSVCSWRIPMRPNLSLSSRPPSSARSDSIISTTSSSSVGAAFKSHYRDGTVVQLDKSIKEIFSLPADWISREYLALCLVWAKERSFLCPRSGEVAVVKSANLL